MHDNSGSRGSDTCSKDLAMMQRTPLAALFGLGLLLSVAGGTPARDAPTSVNDLSMEVAALQLLHYFQFTSEQMKRLRKLAPETMDKEGAARAAAKVSAEFRKTLESLREA